MLPEGLMTVSLLLVICVELAAAPIPLLPFYFALGSRFRVCLYPSLATWSWMSPLMPLSCTFVLSEIRSASLWVVVVKYSRGARGGGRCSWEPAGPKAIDMMGPLWTSPSQGA